MILGFLLNHLDFNLEEKERESLFFFLPVGLHVSQKKNDYTYSNYSTVKHNTMICAQWQKTPKNR